MSDEHLREQFERVITSERFWRQPATKFNPTELLARDDVGGYTNGYIHERWLGWVAGQQARDAEVQALREQVDHAKRIFQYAEVRSGYCVCGETLARHRHLADCSYTDRGQWESELWLKRAAALRGEEGTNDD